MKNGGRMSKRQDLLDKIVEVVTRVRVKQKVTVKPDFKSNKSEEAFGFANVAAGDLLYATDGTGLWNNLGVYDEDELGKILEELKSQL